MIAICLSLVVLGLVSLAECQVEESSDLEAAAETIQVPFLPELSSRASVAVSVFASDTRTLAYS
jgi:hypothetical protein